MSNKHFIYIIKNTINQKIYVGRAKDIKKRWASHKSAAKKNNPRDKSIILYRAMRAYGLHNFYIEQLEECNSIEEAIIAEEKFIENLSSCNREFGYNILPTNSSFKITSYDMKNKKYTEKERYRSIKNFVDRIYPNLKIKENDKYTFEFKECIVYLRKWKHIISIKDISKFFDIEYSKIRDLLSFYKNNILTDEQRMENWIAASTGKHPSIETRMKLSEKKKGSNNHNYGKKLTEAEKQRITRKGKKCSDSSKKKMSENKKGSKHPFFGKHHSIQSKLKMSKSQKGKKHSENTKKKISENNKGKYKIPEEIQKNISNLYKTGNYTRKELSEKFNVNIHTIKSFIQRWK